MRGDVRLAGVQFGHEGDHPVLDGLDLHVAPGRVARARRRDRLREEHRRGTAGASVRPGRRRRPARRPRRARAADRPTSAAPSRSCSKRRSSSRTRVRENIRFARPHANDEDVERAAELAGAAEFIADLPGRLRHGARRARASPSRAGSASASRSRGRSSPIRPCSSSTTRRRRSTRRRSTRSVRR